MRAIFTPPSSEEPITFQVSITWHHLLIGVSALLTLITLFILPGKEFNDDCTVPFILWGASILLMLFALYKIDQTRSVQPSSLTRIDWLLFAGLVILAFLLRFWRISSIPFTMSGDEASQGIETLKVLKGELRNPFVTAWYSVPSMNFFFNSLFMTFIPDRFVGLRLPYALCGSLTVGGTYLLVRQLTGRRLGLLTGALTLVYHYHVHYSRVGSNQVLDPFFMVFALWALYRGLHENRLFYLGLSGVLTGMAMYFYAGARLTIILISGIFLFLAVRSLGKFLKKHWLGVVVFFIAFFITGAQMLQLGVQHPDEFNARVNQIGIIQSGWLDQEAKILETSKITILWNQFVQSFFGFTYYHDRTVWYKPDQPFLDPASSVLLYYGLLFSTILLFKDQRYLPFAAWWWSGTVFGSMLTESPPSSQRLVTLIIPTMFFVALAADRLIQLLQYSLPKLRGNLLYYIFLLLFSYSSLNFYFVEYTPRRSFGGPPAEAATILAPLINGAQGKYPVFLLVDPDTNTEFPTWLYLFEGDYTLLPGPIDTPTQDSFINEQTGALFISTPNRYEDLNKFSEAFPGGDMTQIRSQSIWETEFTLYWISPAQEN